MRVKVEDYRVNMRENGLNIRKFGLRLLGKKFKFVLWEKR